MSTENKWREDTAQSLRGAIVTLVNNTPFTLQRKNASLTCGEWSKLPVEMVLPNSQGNPLLVFLTPFAVEWATVSSSVGIGIPAIEN
jgi:hypothetical protein